MQTDADARRVERAAAMLERGDTTGAVTEANAVLQARPTNARARDIARTAGRSARIRGRSASPTDLQEDAAAAIQSLREAGFEAPVLLPYHQVSPGNPFQSLLYCRAFENGVAPVPLNRIEDLEPLLPFATPQARLVLHLHWVNRVLHGVTARDEARVLAQAFLARLDRLLGVGGELVWSVHNVLPHDCLLPEEEAELRRAIVERATVVHILARATPEAVRPYYTIPPEKILHIPLPGFDGAYEDLVGRAGARYLLGIEPGELVYALIGGLRPYKGLTDMLDAWQALPHDGVRRRLLVAGAPDRSDDSDRFLERAAADPTISLHARTIPANDMQLYLRAADVAVLPYQRTLNSAVLLLALTFGLPVIVPDVPSLVEVVAPPARRTFTPGDHDSLVAALVDAGALADQAARLAARESANAFAPAMLSERFARGIVEATGRERRRAADPPAPQPPSAALR